MSALASGTEVSAVSTLGHARFRALAQAAVVLFVIVAAAGLRLVSLDSRDLFRDEAASWLLSSYPWGDIGGHMASESYPPLYFYLLKAWMWLFGDARAALRSMSAVAGMGVVLVTFVWAREALGRVEAPLAAFLVGVGPLSLADAREARMYAFEALFVTVSWWLLWRCLVDERPLRDRLPQVATLSLVAAAQPWTMPTGLATLLLQVLVVAVVAIRKRGRVVAGAAGIGIGALLFLPWLPQVLRNADVRNASWTPPPTLAAVPHSLQTLISGTIPSPAWDVAPGFLVLAVTGVAVVARAPGTPTRIAALCLAGGMSLVPLWWLGSLIHPAYDARYLGPAIPPLAIGVAAAIVWLCRAVMARGNRWLTGLLAIALTALAAGYASGSLALDVSQIANQGIQPARATVLELERYMRPGDVALALDARSYFSLAYETRQTFDPVHLPGPIWHWRNQTEPSYFGGGLIERGQTIQADQAINGSAVSIPGLAPGGSIWVVSLVAGSDMHTFAPLSDGLLRETQRTVVRGNGDWALLVQLVPANLPTSSVS